MAQGANLSPVTIKVDGAPDAVLLGGLAIPLNPGTHVIRFESPGRVPLDRTVVAREGERDRHVTVVMSLPETLSGVRRSDGSLGTQKTLALVSGGIGAVALLVGAFSGLVALAYSSTDTSATCSVTPSLCNSGSTASTVAIRRASWSAPSASRGASPSGSPRQSQEGRSP